MISLDRFDGVDITDIQNTHGCSVCGEVIYFVGDVELGICASCQWFNTEFEEDDNGN